MATIVQHRASGDRFVLIGTGFGATKAPATSVTGFLGHIEHTHASDEKEMLCVCDADGAIGWCLTEEMLVVSVDGQPPARHLSREPFR